MFKWKDFNEIRLLSYEVSFPNFILFVIGKGTVSLFCPPGFIADSVIKCTASMLLYFVSLTLC